MVDQLIFAEQLRQLRRKLGIFDQCQVSCCGISPAQCLTIAELGQTEGISLGELAARLGVDNSTMSRTITSLANCGLVERSIDNADRRYVVLALSGEGKKIFAEIDTAFNRQAEQVWMAISTEQRDQLADSLAILLRALGKGCC